ncbi:hypothetical protein TUM4261_30970 [Shewanella sp. c952]|uniref:hypothetical protein n=1 Tax=Shewanella sp. c952 TaxID=2815913 RepID=UPI001BBD0001|nr:hypothetical protein [Shewanella sp. c952]GIU14881.1 hypothetical protein TUM4261_30970 [Shewanella sp. c952]
MYSSRQLNRQHAGLAAQIIIDEKLSVLCDSVQTSIKLTQRALLKRCLESNLISSMTLLSHKSEALELHRAILSAEIGEVEQKILLGYIDQNIEMIDDYLCMNPKVQSKH